MKYIRVFISLLFIFLTVIISSPSYSEVLKGGISAVDMIPDEFYGTWSVISTRVETNNENFFKERTSDIWILQRAGNAITLTNPATLATSTISVDEVENNTAKFSRASKSKYEDETEHVIITINDNTFIGEDSLEMKKFSTDNKLIEHNIVKYRLEGKKISGRNAILYKTIRE